MGASKKKQPSAEMVHTKLLENLDEVVLGFVKAAKEGSCAHFKLICELLKDGDKKTQRDPARVLLEQWRREQRQKRRIQTNARMHGPNGRFVPDKVNDGTRGGEEEIVEGI
jgi:hypothetical protein